MIWELIICILLLVLTFDFIKILQLQEKLKPIPITCRIPIFGSSFQMSSFRPENLHEKFREFTQRYGKSFAACAFGTTIVVTSDPRYIEPLITSQEHIRKFRLYYLLSTWLGNGLLLSHSKKWQRMRKVITPAFHFKILEQFVDVFDRQSIQLVEELKKFSDGQQIFDIYPYIGLTTLDIIVETAMGVKVNALENAKSDFVHAVNSVTEILATRFMQPHLAFPFVFRILSPNLYARQKRGIDIMHNFTVDIIRQRRRVLETQGEKTTTQHNEDIQLKSHKAFLDILLQVTIDGNPLTDSQIHDEVNTFVFEGHDTTASAISFCLYLLSRNPQCQQKLFEEIREHFGDDPKRSVTYSDLLHLDYLTCIVKESLRLYPPIPSIGRWIENELKLDDVTLPAGTNIIVLIWELLHNPEFFPEPMRFHPERHLEDNSHSNAYVYIPFSAGPRNCIGQRFALFEMKTIVVNMLRHYELLEAGEDVQPSMKIVLKSSTGINFAIRPRVY